jgi:hypothetical protein
MKGIDVAKPIFIIRFPYTNNFDQMEKYLKMYKEIGEQMTDYHVLCPMDNSVERVEFECYNAINATDVEIEELKQMILEKIKTNE